MEILLAVMNPATGTELPIWMFVVSGVVLAGCIVAAVVANNMKKKKNVKKNGKLRPKK